MLPSVSAAIKYDFDKNDVISALLLESLEQNHYTPMKYDDAFARQAGVDNKNGLINLSYFINAKKGVCRHQALLVGYLLERLKGEGYIDGKVSIDRNSVTGEDASGNWPYRRPKEMQN